MEKQTVVEQLQIWLNSHLSHEQQMQFEGLFQQAKQMEKQQIIETWNDAIYCNTTGNEINYEDGEQYYQETFKSE